MPSVGKVRESIELRWGERAPPGKASATTETPKICRELYIYIYEYMTEMKGEGMEKCKW